MKTAVYIEQGVVQLVLTPENEFEKNALQSFGTQPMVAGTRQRLFRVTKMNRYTLNQKMKQ